MKNFIKISFCLLLTIFFSSCVDYVQSVSLKNGKYNLYYKMICSKELLNYVDEDVNEIIDYINSDEVLEEIPSYLSINPVDNDTEVGFELSALIDPKKYSSSDDIQIPKKDGNILYVPFLLGQSSISESLTFDTEEEEMAASYLFSTAKCSVFISKNIAPTIRTAYFNGIHARNYIITCYDYGDMYCLEIPFKILYEVENYNIDQIVVVIK